jgi:hypothetical protein
MREKLSLSRAGVILLSLFVALSTALAEDLRCKISEGALKDAAQIRGLNIKRATPCLVSDKEDVRKYLLATIDEKIPQARLLAEQAIYKSFGFLPYDFDYEKGLVQLYLDQLGGYYDPVKKHYVMAAWIPDFLQNSVAVHELTHALQDQHFNLETFLDHQKYSTDELLARSALVEGDATAVMMDYTFKQVNQPALAQKPDVSGIILQNSLGTFMMPGLSQVPLSLKLMLLFPYSSGLRFAHEGLKRNGYLAINQMFKSPPKSTEEILHPEKYFGNKVDFKELPIPSLKEGEILFKDTLGEFSISALLATHVADKDKVARAAAGWGGDRVVLIGQGAIHKQAIWHIAWDSTADAAEFCSLYKSIVPKLQSFGVNADQKKIIVNCSDFETVISRDL